MNTSNPLQEIALLGISRKPLVAEQLPAPIEEVIGQLPPLSDEEKLLSILGLQHFYHQAGSLPQSYEGDWDASPIMEEKAFAEEGLAKILYAIQRLTAEAQKDILPIWLEALVKNNWIVPPQLMKPLLKMAKSLPKPLQMKISEVVGNQGLWVMEQLPAFSLKQSPIKSEEKTLLKGKPKERRILLDTLFASDKKYALDLIQTLWPKASFRIKVDFLDRLKYKRPPKDLMPFLEDLYTGELQYDPSASESQKKCRKILASTLLLFPQSRLSQDTIRELANYSEQTGLMPLKSLVGNIKGKSLRLPLNHDSFFNPSFMESQYGMEAQNPSFPSDISFWFSRFVCNLPIAQWMKLLEKDLAGTVKYFLKSREFQHVNAQGKKGSYLEGPLFHSLGLDRENVPFARELILQTDEKGHALLNSLLPAEVWEAHILQHQLFDSPNAFSHQNLDIGKEWSLSFSKKFLEGFTDAYLSKATKRHKVILLFIDHRLHTDTLPFLEKIEHKVAIAISKDPSLSTLDFQPLKESLRIRKRIKPYLLNTI